MSNDDDKVGYGRPPKAGRFEAGRSGNPRGRPKGSKGINKVAQEVLGKRVAVREGGKVRKVPALEAIVTKQTHQALLGDSKATAAVLKLAASTALTDIEQHSQPLTAAEKTILRDVLRRGNYQLPNWLSENEDSASNS